MYIDKKAVGAKIHKIRQQNGYSMEQFGKQIGNAPKGSVNSWEKGVNLPATERLELIALLGNTTVNELLYGSIEDYITNLVHTNLGIKLLNTQNQLIDFILQAGYTYGDDIEILRFAKGVFNANHVITNIPSLFYLPISEPDNLFIGYLQKEKSDHNNIPYFYAFSDMKNHTLHLVPFPLSNEVSKYYAYPEKILQPSEHDFFTSGLLSLKLQLRYLTILYYGIDIDEPCLKFTKLTYDIKSDSLMPCLIDSNDSDLYAPFMKCIEKELLYIMDCKL